MNTLTVICIIAGVCGVSIAADVSIYSKHFHKWLKKNKFIQEVIKKKKFNLRAFR